MRGWFGKNISPLRYVDICWAKLTGAEPFTYAIKFCFEMHRVEAIEVQFLHW